MARESHPSQTYVLLISASKIARSFFCSPLSDPCLKTANIIHRTPSVVLLTPQLPYLISRSQFYQIFVMQFPGCPATEPKQLHFKQSPSLIIDQPLSLLDYNRQLQTHDHTGSPGQSQCISVTQSKMNSMNMRKRERDLWEERVLTGDRGV